MAALPVLPVRTTVPSFADRYVTDLADASTEVATALGTHPGDDACPTSPPTVSSALDDLARATLTALPGGPDR